MFCPYCGTRLPDDSQFCCNCGAPQNAHQAPNQTPRQPQYAPNSIPQQAPYGFAPLGMKWYKFLIYFALIAGGILNLISGIICLTGGQYGSTLEAKIVYTVFPSLKIIDIIYGIACIAFGVFQIYTRSQLASFKEKAPQYVIAMYVINGAYTAIYSFVASGMIDTILPAESAQLSSQAVGAIIVAILFAWLNKIYFDKRKHLFINQ